MITPDRLDELETFRLEDDTPPDARISIPWRDLRDLVALIPKARLLLAIQDHLRAEMAKVGVDFDNPLGEPPERKVGE